ncbi:MAG TPA: adenylate/guanylate cyclase domain-containing protein [bacterium]|nr:adenylate/guanylate cyclase domain-containing protein [bacterium]
MKCPRCEFENPAGLRFCGQCGARLVEGPGSRVTLEERKVVTMLFADVTGSTMLAEQLDPEEMRGIMGRFFDAMSRVIGRHGGAVEKFIGDEVMAVFGLPAAHEDDPERAVRAALEMHAELERLNEGIQGRGGATLQMRVGINTGEVVANPHAVEKGEFMVTGDAVNVAARLRSASEPGGTIVGERTYRRSEWMAEYDECGPLQLKGKAEAVRAWRLRGLRAEPVRRHGLRAPLVGRASELVLLQDLLQGVIRERQPQLVIILGLPGVGKSRLFEEVAAAHPEAAVRLGRSLPYGTTSMWAVAEILRADCSILRSDVPAVAIAKLQSRLAELFATERASEREAVSTQLSRLLALGAREEIARVEDAREELFWALRRFVVALAAGGPLILAFEDAHSADAALLDLVESLAGTAAGPILLVCLARPELLDLRPSWAGGKRNYTSLFLEPLAEADTHALIERLLSTTEVPPQVHDAVSGTGGNPLFIEEILRMLLDRGALVRSDGRWEMAAPLTVMVPDSVQGVITTRLDQLGREEKTAALDASVLGKDFWMGALEAISGRSPEILDPLLGVLVEKDFLIERAASRLEGQREFTFKHMLIHDIAYSVVPKAARAGKHRAFGVWLEQTLGERGEEFADLLAYHWLQATRLAEEVGAPPGNSGQKAVHYALLAGRKAARVYANEQALTHFQTAQTLAASLNADAERVAAIEGQADVYALQARWDDASRLYQEALDYHLRQGDAVGQAKVQSRMGSTFSGIFDFRQALPHVQSAMETLRSHRDERELAAIYLQMARTHTAMGQLKEAEAYAHSGAQLAEQYSLLPQLAEGEWALGFISTLLGRDDAPQRFERCIKIAERVGDLGWVIQGLAWAAFRHRWRGEYAQARESYARAFAIAEGTNNRPRMAFCLIGTGETHFLSGNWSAAGETWARYLQMSDEIPAWVEHVRATVAFMRGDHEDAVAWAEQFLAHAERRREVTSVVLAVDRCAAYYLRAGRIQDARQVLTEALRRFAPLFWSAFFHPLAAEAALAAGDVSAAIAHCAQTDALPWADLQPARARLLRARAMIAATSAAWTEAIELMREAVETYRHLGQLYDYALGVELVADLHAKRGAGADRDQAAALRREALSLYQQVGAVPDMRRLENQDPA